MAEVPADLHYTPEHEYVRRTSDPAVVEVGITDFAQGELGDIVFLDLPKAGATFARMGVFGTVESVKAVSELFAPLSGTVTEVNASIKERPDAVNSAPHDTWMIKVQLADPADADALMTAADYEASLAH